MRRKIEKQKTSFAGSYDYYWTWSSVLKRRCLWVLKDGYLHCLTTDEKFKFKPKVKKK
jgi:hypothetical protein